MVLVSAAFRRTVPAWPIRGQDSPPDHVTQADFLTGLRTAIDVLPIPDGDDTDYRSGKQLRACTAVPADRCVHQALRDAGRNQRHREWLHDGSPDVDVGSTAGPARCT
jgi:hypothetical protein